MYKRQVPLRSRTKILRLSTLKQIMAKPPQEPKTRRQKPGKMKQKKQRTQRKIQKMLRLRNFRID